MYAKTFFFYKVLHVLVWRKQQYVRMWVTPAENGMSSALRDLLLNYAHIIHTVCLEWFPSTVIGGSALIGFTCVLLAPLYLSHTPAPHTICLFLPVCFVLVFLLHFLQTAWVLKLCLS